MTQQRLSILQKKGQVTIPLTFRQKLGVREGDYVAFWETKAGIIVTRGEVLANKALDQIGKTLKKKGISLKELLASGREIRSQLLTEKYP